MSEKPLVLIGGLSRDDRDRVREFSLRLNAPVYAEPLSGLREDAELESLLLRNERILRLVPSLFPHAVKPSRADVEDSPRRDT